ncbi:hypothetical protein EDD17DRAFT_1629273 [Pisolithus thermaeus]|nr:hypothetical protein EDD17DRAFT_1629273 [Pisolithus thermaeus]
MNYRTPSLDPCGVLLILVEWGLIALYCYVGWDQAVHFTLNCIRISRCAVLRCGPMHRWFQCALLLMVPKFGYLRYFVERPKNQAVSTT